MADFDSFDYSIEKRLPEWWKGFGALEPINKYTQDVIAQILEALLTTMGVTQPLNCWLSIPEEYNWYHHYYSTDSMLQERHGDEYLDETRDDNYINKAVTTLYPGSQIIAKLPNTKRNCHAKIKLKLLGTDVVRAKDDDNVEYIDRRNGTDTVQIDFIDTLTIRNADQKITFSNISTTSTIEIDTKTGEILIDDISEDNLIEGEINKIKPVIKDSTYTNLNIQDENKKTELVIESNKKVHFDLQIYLEKPTYTTEQNFRIATVSAFPIESVELWGYFCHPFNNQAGYEFLWEKKYTEQSRTVYDHITKQFDCERFYIKVKFYGIDTVLEKGFPQEVGASKKAFQPNPNLDKWGRILSLPRRIYKPDITEDEEPFTFPKYYKYPIEQDYWYEERMVNEYNYDEDSINALFVKDDEFNNIGMLECIYPFMNDIWVYTETIDPGSDKIRKIQNETEEYITLCNVEENENSLGKEWEDPSLLKNEPISITLNPQSDNILKLNDKSYQTKMLKLSFNLRPFENSTPKNITIKGIELKFKTDTSVQSNTIKLKEDSSIIIPYPNPQSNSNYIKEKINIIQSEEVWLQNKGYYTIGGEDNIFGEEQITREQLFNGNDGKIEFELGFINDNKFLESILYIKDVILNIYYEIIPSEYDINVGFDKKEIDIRKENDFVTMKIDIKNTGKIEVHNKNITIIIPQELEIKNPIDPITNKGCNSYTFNLEVGEVCPPIYTEIKPFMFENGIKTGWYDILVICEDKVFSNEILVRGNQS